MANVEEGQSLKDYGNRKKRYKKRRRAIISAVLLLIAIIGGIYLLNLYNRSYQSCTVMNTIDISGENAVGYFSYGNAMVKYSKNGVQAIDKDGSALWNGSYELQEPITDTCGKYVVVAGKGSREIHIFNQKGEVGTIPTDYNIQKVEIANQGVVAVMMEDDNTNYINLYDVDGTELTAKETHTNNEGYPLDFSLSDDGKRLVTSYVSYSGGVLADKVAFYNFGEVGQNLKDRCTGGYIFDNGILAPRVVFVNNDTVCVFKENGFTLYSMKEIQSEIATQNVEGQIKSIFYNNDYVGMVLQTDGTSAKHIVMYDLKGKKVLDKALDFDYEKIYMTSDEIIMYDNMSCLIMKLNGKTKFRYTFDKNIDAIYPINNFDRYFLASGNTLSEIQLKE